jgi:hypothetical protein
MYTYQNEIWNRSTGEIRKNIMNFFFTMINCCQHLPRTIKLFSLFYYKGLNVVDWPLFKRTNRYDTAFSLWNTVRWVIQTLLWLTQEFPADVSSEPSYKGIMLKGATDPSVVIDFFILFVFWSWEVHHTSFVPNCLTDEVAWKRWILVGKVFGATEVNRLQSRRD